MAALPTDTVTFLFTDIEGSTRLWERDASAMKSAMVRHDEILKEAIETNGGFVFKTVGDALCAAFSSVPEALGTALVAQRALHDEDWEEGATIRVRMALHTGAVEERGGDYFGPALNRVSRLLSAGHGGQTLLSLATRELVRDALPAGARLDDLGERRLQGLSRPEHVFQITAPGLPSEFPPLRTLENLRNNLPLQPTPLIGREREVGEACERLRREEVRLLTLTGPGGTGKTRLALQAAADLLEDFEDGVFFVYLAATTDPDLFLTQVAGALGLQESGDVSLENSLKEYLRRRELLLVLDNFEQILSAVPLVEELLSAAPRLKMLATSRTPLGIYGEHEYAVPPLSVPDPKRLPDLEALSQYEAVRLFIARAGAAKAGFEITNENAPAVAEICVRLDGLPLAIELAAARVKLLPPKAILTRLANRLRLLTGGAKDLPERQRTLRGAMEWSHDLLDDGERTLFARLAVFSGGRTLEAIEAICDAKEDLPVDAFEGVSSLLDKSLIQQEEGPEEEPRFVMLETIHEYAREKLEQSGEAEEIGRAHMDYFLALAEEAELGGTKQALWMERLEAEHDNLRAALSRSLEGEDPELGLRLASALLHFWFLRGYWSEGRAWLEEALAGNTEAPAPARAKALAGLAGLALEQTDYGLGETYAQESLALYRGLGDDKGISDSLAQLGKSSWLRGDFERAEAFMEESVEAARRSDDVRLIVVRLTYLSGYSGNLGDVERAEALLEESLPLARKLGDRRAVSSVLLNMGTFAAVRGDFERADSLLEESLAISRESKDPPHVCWALLILGTVATRRGDHGRARTLLGESLALSKRLGSTFSIVEHLESLAELTGVLGDPRRAARLWGAAGALREAAGTPQPPAERRLREPYLIAARSRMEEADWTMAWEEGRAMTLAQAVDYALEGVGDRAMEQD